MLNPKKIRQHEGKIIFLMSLWQARKIAAFVQRATSQTTYPAHVAKKIIHRNVGTKGNSKNDTEKMYVEWITTLIVTHHSLSLPCYMLWLVYMSIFISIWLTLHASYFLPTSSYMWEVYMWDQQLCVDFMLPWMNIIFIFLGGIICEWCL